MYGGVNMGFFSKLFGKKEKEPIVKTSITVNNVEPERRPTAKVPAAIQDLVLIALSEKYKTTETDYPDSLRTSYGIGFPKEKLWSLAERGYIRTTSMAESLSHLKVVELKTLASSFGIKAYGKKADICQRIIAEAPPADLEALPYDRYWKITDSGRALLDFNPYIEFYVNESQKYSLEYLGISIKDLADLYSNASNKRVRDLVWGEFNRKSIELYSEAMSKGEFDKYCTLLGSMGVFLADENRHKEALLMYMRKMFYYINFQAPFYALKEYSVLKDVDSAAETLLMRAYLYPNDVKQIMNASGKCGFNSTQLKEFMDDTFKKEQDIGIFTPQELSDYLMYGFNADEENQMKLCKIAIRRASKNLPKKK